MEGPRLNQAKKALQYFIRSLPPNSIFNIISFGGKFEKMHKNSVEYNKKNIELTCKLINQFKANFGGTNIFSPMKDILQEGIKPEYPRFVFLMTDGCVQNEKKVINLVEKINKHKVYAIGIGNGCSEFLIN